MIFLFKSNCFPRPSLMVPHQLVLPLRNSSQRQNNIHPQCLDQQGSRGVWLHHSDLFLSRKHIHLGLMIKVFLWVLSTIANLKVKKKALLMILLSQFLKLSLKKSRKKLKLMKLNLKCWRKLNLIRNCKKKLKNSKKKMKLKKKILKVTWMDSIYSRKCTISHIKTTNLIIN